MLSVLLVGRLLAAGAIMPTIATVAARQEPPLTGLAARTAALPPPSWEPNWNLTQSPDSRAGHCHPAMTWASRRRPASKSASRAVLLAFRHPRKGVASFGIWAVFQPFSGFFGAF